VLWKLLVFAGLIGVVGLTPKWAGLKFLLVRLPNAGHEVTLFTSEFPNYVREQVVDEFRVC
jgi:uncharacterized membrane protein YesL